MIVRLSITNVLAAVNLGMSRSVTWANNRLKGPLEGNLVSGSESSLASDTLALRVTKHPRAWQRE